MLCLRLLLRRRCHPAACAAEPRICRRSSAKRELFSRTVETAQHLSARIGVVHADEGRLARRGFLFVLNSDPIVPALAGGCGGCEGEQEKRAASGVLKKASFRSFTVAAQKVERRF